MKTPQSVEFRTSSSTTKNVEKLTDSDMYRIAAQTFLNNYPLFVAAALALAVIEAIGIDVGAGATIVVCGILALYSHRMILLGENYGWVGGPKLASGERMPMWAFLWRYGLFMLVFIATLLLVFLPLLPSGGADKGLILVTLLAALLVVAPIMACIFALFGTVLPASAIGGDRSWSSALRRGRKRFLATVARLALGPGLFTVANVMLMVVLMQFVNSGVTAFMVNFAGYLLSFFPLHLTAVALSLAYREAEAMGAQR